jgi:tyrosine-protein kinase Etk/Wzc
VTDLPAPRVPERTDLSPRPEWQLAGDGQEIRLGQLWGAAWRNRWIILGCAICGLAGAVVVTARARPLYRAYTTVRIEDKQPNLPTIYRSDMGDELGTEAEVLGSRSLAEGAADSLAVQFRLVQPTRVPRSQLFDSVFVVREAPSGSYQLRRRPDGRYSVIEQASGNQVATAGIGERVWLPGARFVLSQRAAQYDRIEFTLNDFDSAVGGLLGALDASQVGRNVQILRLDYEDSDPDLVWQVPNIIVGGFIRERNEDAQDAARTTVAFLRRQLDTVSAQLRVSEDALRDYRERSRTVNPESEASGQVSRLITMQSERLNVEAERSALAQLLEAADAKAARQRPEDPSPYRELLAFPTLLRSQAATSLLQALTSIEQDRTALLARRTAEDPDVKALTSRIEQVQTQLRGVVASYLQGLTNQVGTLDTGLAQFSRQLSAIPDRELQVARLERTPKVLEGIYTLLQTRLHEAEIAAASRDATIRIIDPAIAPHGPSRPRRSLNLVLGLMAGLLLGGLIAGAREYRDKTVHTRTDIRAATGLPVLGLIPRLRRSRGAALITEKRRLLRPPERPAERPAEKPAAPARRRYTFLDTAGAEDSGAADSLVTEPVIGPAEILQMGLSEAAAPAVEAYAVLQTNIAFSRTGTIPKVLVLTSPLPGEGKTTSAVNLAATLARRGSRVLLVDADLRRGSVHRLFDVARGPGLTEVLRGTARFADVLRAAAIEGQTMHYLTTGEPVRNPAAFLESAAMRGLLDECRRGYDTVLLDSPPTNVVTDAAILAAASDGVVMVVRAGVTESAALASAMEQLRQVQAPLLGVLLNDIDFKRDASYDGAYRYYSYDQYSTSPG